MIVPRFIIALTRPAPVRRLGAERVRPGADALLIVQPANFRPVRPRVATSTANTAPACGCIGQLPVEPAIRRVPVHRRPAVDRDPQAPVLVDGQAVSLIPESVPKILEALTPILRKSRRPRRPALSPGKFRASVFELTNLGRTTLLQLLDPFDSCHSRPEQVLVIEAATELRGYIMHLGGQAGGVLPD